MISRIAPSKSLITWSLWSLSACLGLLLSQSVSAQVAEQAMPKDQAVIKKQSVTKSVAELLNQYAWKKRQLIVHAPSAEHEQLALFNRIAEEFAEEFEDRRLHTWRVIADQPVTLEDKIMETANGEQFQDYFQFKDDEFVLVLVGYDQGEKLRQTKVDIDFLFAEIDQMPMRQMEMGM